MNLRASTYAVDADCPSVPTLNDIAVPESVLKKQKAASKANEQRAADLKKKREVR